MLSSKWRFVLNSIMMICMFAGLVGGTTQVKGETPGPIITLSAGTGHTDGIRTDGTVISWGGNSPVFVPAPGSFKQISAGSIHDCGIRTDGTLACWGYNDDGRATPPEGIYTQVSSSEGNCAIRLDGTLACWGPNSFGSLSPTLEDLSYRYTQISTGPLYSCGITNQGKVRCWGYNGYGGATPPASTFTQVEVGTHTTCGIQTDGELVCWGYPVGPGFLPEGSFTQVALPYGGDWHDVCGLKTDGTLACWGPHSYYEGFVPPTGIFTQIMAGSDHLCALKADGTGTCWGRMDYGREGGPFPPMDLTVSLQSGTDLFLSWTDISIDEASFRVERSLDGESWTRIATLEPNTTSYLDTNLSPSISYFYRVMACRTADGDCSSYSNVAASSELPEPPTLHANLAGNEIHAHNWNLDATVTLSIDDNTASHNLLYTTTEKVADHTECGQPCFDLGDQFQLSPGMRVTLTDNQWTKQIVVTDLHGLSANVANNTVAGVAAPESIVWVTVFTPDGNNPMRQVTAGPDGAWSADFSLPGPEPFEQLTFDLVEGISGRAIQFEHPGINDDGTIAYWNIPSFARTLHVNYEGREIHGHDWPASSVIHLVLSENEQPVYMADWMPGEDNSCGTPCFYLPENILLQPGLTAALTEDNITHSVIVQEVRIRYTDPVRDIVSGFAEPGSVITVNTFDAQAVRHITTGSDGIWIADFTTPGPQPDEQVTVDLVEGTSGRAIALVSPERDDGSIGYWQASNPDIDNDGIQNWMDNAPATFNPDQRDLDQDGTADVIDPCPADSTNSCNPSGSAASSIGTGGGEIITPDNSASMSLPPDALSGQTSMSITAVQMELSIFTDQGQMKPIMGVEIGPAGMQFARPITITLNWNDADSDGYVDGTNIPEVGLVISKNGEVITQRCEQDPGCDPATNRFATQVASLSVFALGELEDQTPPTIQFLSRTPANAFGWNLGPVTVTWSCTDEQSGVLAQTISKTISSEGANQSVTGVCEDRAGNRASDQQSGINIDTTAPILTPQVSPNPVILNGNAVIDPGAMDSLSGIDMIHCDALDARTVGTKSATCTATDKAGNSASADVHYRVIYHFDGFLQPINDTGHQTCPGCITSIFKGSSTIPTLFQLKDADGKVVQATRPPEWMTPRQGGPTSAILDEGIYSDLPTSGSVYVWAEDHYQYNWKTRGVPTGFYWQIGVRLDDGMTYTVSIGLR